MIDKLERPKYRKKFPGKGLLFFVAGSLLALKLFSSNWNIALAAIAILTAGDSVSHLVGIASRKNKSKLGKFSKKSFLSTIAGVIAGFIAGSLFITPLLALAGAFIAMIIENFSVRVGFEEVDDNIIVPLIAGTVMYLILKI